MVSGVGLLLLSMTNRLGRIVDRSRALSRERQEAAGPEEESIAAQLAILGQRAELVRRAIALAAFSVLFAALLVISLFLIALFGADLPWLVAGLFILSMLCLIASLILFIRDINKSLKATALEMGAPWDRRGEQTKPNR